MYSTREALIWLLGVLGLAVTLKACEVNASTLEKQAKAMGFKKAPKTVYKAIEYAAKRHNVNPQNLLSIAIVESSLNPRAVNYNTNGTLDYGLFQINEVVANSDCQEYNIYNVRGNALCAAKMLSMHKKTGDYYYIGRYRSKTPSIKTEYHYKVQKVKGGLNEY